jgi:hypothetical protein
MSDYREIHRDLDRAISLLMASIYQRPAGYEGSEITCDPSPFVQAVMQIARTSQWAAGLHEGHEAYAEKNAPQTIEEPATCERWFERWVQAYSQSGRAKVTVEYEKMADAFEAGWISRRDLSRQAGGAA